MVHWDLCAELDICWLQFTGLFSYMSAILFVIVLYDVLIEIKSHEKPFQVNLRPKFIGLLILSILLGIGPVIMASANVPFPLFGLNHDETKNCSEL